MGYKTASKKNLMIIMNEATKTWKQVKKEHRSKARRTTSTLADIHPVGASTFLAEKCQSKLKSSTTIADLPQCVHELLLNSLDSNSNCISVRIDLSSAFIQVIDNGEGISQKSFLKLGERHSSSKPLPPLITGKSEPQSSYGHRGEALASIIELSEKVEILSRAQCEKSGDTYCKTIKGGVGSVEKTLTNRPCAGTTLTVYNLFYKAPVRMKHMQQSQTMNEIVTLVQSQAICLAGKVSISLRDEEKGKVLLNTSRIKTVKVAILEVFGGTYCSDLHTLRGRCGDIQLCGVISTVAYPGKKIKLITVNGRLVISNRILQTIDTQLKASNINTMNSVSTTGNQKGVFNGDRAVSKPRHYLYCLDIICEKTLYTTNTQSSITSVEFISWQIILNSVYKIIKKFLIKYHLHKNVSAKPDTSVVSLQEDRDSLSYEKAKSQSSQPNQQGTECDENTALEVVKESQPRQKIARADNKTPRDKMTAAKNSEVRYAEVAAVDRMSRTDMYKLPHVVYWLLKHVPKHVPLCTIEEDIPSGVGSTQASMYVQPGSPCHASSVSRHSDRKSLTSQSVDSSWLHYTMSSKRSHSKRSHSMSIPDGKRRRYNTSFNEGENSATLFGLKLKVYPSQDENLHRELTRSARRNKPSPAINSARYTSAPRHRALQKHRSYKHQTSPHFCKLTPRTRSKADDYLIGCLSADRPRSRVFGQDMEKFPDKQHYSDIYSPQNRPRTSATRYSKTCTPTYRPFPVYKSPLYNSGGRRRHSRSTPMKRRSISTLQQAGDDYFSLIDQTAPRSVTRNNSLADLLHIDSPRNPIDKASMETLSPVFCRQDELPLFLGSQSSVHKHPCQSDKENLWPGVKDNVSNIHTERNLWPGYSTEDYVIPPALGPKSDALQWNIPQIAPMTEQRKYQAFGDTDLVPTANHSAEDSRGTFDTDKLLGHHYMQHMSANQITISNEHSLGLDDSASPSVDLLLDDLFGVRKPRTPNQQKQLESIQRHHLTNTCPSKSDNQQDLHHSTCTTRQIEYHNPANYVQHVIGFTDIQKHFNSASNFLHHRQKSCYLTANSYPDESASISFTASHSISDVMNPHVSTCDDPNICSAYDSTGSHAPDNVTHFLHHKQGLKYADEMGDSNGEEIVMTCDKESVSQLSINCDSEVLRPVNDDATGGQVIKNSDGTIAALSGCSGMSVKTKQAIAYLKQKLIAVRCEDSSSTAVVCQQNTMDGEAAAPSPPKVVEEPVETDNTASNYIHPHTSAKCHTVESSLDDVSQLREESAQVSPSPTELQSNHQSPDINFSTSSGWTDIAADIVWSGHNVKSSDGMAQLIDGTGAELVDNRTIKETPGHPETNNTAEGAVGVVRTSQEKPEQVRALPQADDPHIKVQDNLVSSSQPADTKLAGYQRSGSLISSFTSEEMKFLNCEPTKTGYDDEPVKCFVDSLIGNTNFQTAMPTREPVESDSRPCTPPPRPQFIFRRVRTPYTTPRRLPSICDILTQDPNTQPQESAGPNLLPFRKGISSPLTTQSQITLTPELLVNCTVIGQLGKQFILTLCEGGKGEEVLLAVDQHAAHERVRLEMLERDNINTVTGQIRCVKLTKSVRLDDINPEVIKYIRDENNIEKLKITGLRFVSNGELTMMTHVPAVIRQTYENNSSFLMDYIEAVVTQISEHIGATPGRPKAFHYFICSVSCRGAIKFGDDLSSTQCTAVINSLSRCRLSFQCAHGRPSCVPLYDISTISQAIEKKHTKLNFKKLWNNC